VNLLQCPKRMRLGLAPIIAERILDEGIIYDCPWDDFRFNYFRGNSETAARELGLGAAVGTQGGV
jgi:hypothetical protein